jgi:hypothetical protein
MSESTISRLTFPAIISLLGLGITQAWYMKTTDSKPLKANAGDAIAILATKNDVIERRPTTRIIWERLGQGEQLYGGEAVRTGPKSSGKITFIKSGMSIGLEPDSLVIMEESNGKLQLNLVNGGVFVRNDASNGGTNGSSSGSKNKTEQPILKAGDKKIELSGKSSELNLSVSDSGMANVQVAKGDAKIASAEGKMETLKEGASKALSTNAGAPAILDLSGPRSGSGIPISGLNDQVSLSWNNAPDGSMIFLETGNTRDTLTRLPQGIAGKSGKINLPVRPGDFFWRMVAVKDGKIVAMGPTTFNQGVTMDPPKLLTYASNEKIILSNANQNPQVRLSWTRPAGAEDIGLILAKDPDFKNILASKTFNVESEWTVPVKDSGKYYWRATAKWPGIARSVPSSTGIFEAIKQKDIPAPVANAPVPGSIIPKTTADQSGIMLTWSGEEGTETFELELLRRQNDNSLKSVLTRSLSNRQFRLTNVPPGQYFWTVRAKIGSQQSQPSPKAAFTVSEVSRIQLKDPPTNEKPLMFASADTPLTLALGDLPTTSSELRFKIARSSSGLADAPWQSSSPGKPLQFRVPAAGTYQMNIEALNKNKEVVGFAENIEIMVKEPDLLPPPALITGDQPIKTGESGDVTLRWKSVTGATRYLVEISSPKTKFRKAVQGTQLNLTNLLPGTHTLIMASIDKSGRTGIKSQGITIEVPDISSIAAPKSKGIKIR